MKSNKLAGLVLGFGISLMQVGCLSYSDMDVASKEAEIRSAKAQEKVRKYDETKQKGTTIEDLNRRIYEASTKDYFPYRAARAD